jgi:hypothetical protein
MSISSYHTAFPHEYGSCVKLLSKVSPPVDETRLDEPRNNYGIAADVRVVDQFSRNNVGCMNRGSKPLYDDGGKKNIHCGIKQLQHQHRKIARSAQHIRVKYTLTPVFGFHRIEKIMFFNPL